MPNALIIANFVFALSVVFILQVIALLKANARAKQTERTRRQEMSAFLAGRVDKPLLKRWFLSWVWLIVSFLLMIAVIAQQGTA